jgi:hypothetical protein
MTVGSITPCVALHPSAQRMREAVRRIADEQSIAWLECQSRKDPMNFWDFDPVTGIGVDASAQRCNPLVWKLRFRDLLSHDFYKQIRFRFFRLHFQFIMANDKRGYYDYLMLVSGPVPVEEWPKRQWHLVDEFAIDGSYRRLRSVAAEAQNGKR